MSAPRIVVVEHESTCPPALFGDWLAEAGCALTVCRPWAGDELPPLDAYDGWLVLGGTMNAYADDVAPWLPEVRARFARAAADGVPALGICLGHQLAAMEDGEVQAARFAPTVWGVQWHPEVDRAVATSWAEGDRDDHLERGIDQEALLASIEAASAELEAAWRPLALSFAALVRDAG